jgi:hypothetical protein
LAERAERPREPQALLVARRGKGRHRQAARRRRAHSRVDAHAGVGLTVAPEPSFLAAIASRRRSVRVRRVREKQRRTEAVGEENGARVSGTVGAWPFCSREKIAPPSDEDERSRSFFAAVGFFRPRRARVLVAQAQVRLACTRAIRVGKASAPVAARGLSASCVLRVRSALTTCFLRVGRHDASVARFRGPVVRRSVSAYEPLGRRVSSAPSARTACASRVRSASRAFRLRGLSAPRGEENEWAAAKDTETAQITKNIVYLFPAMI